MVAKVDNKSSKKLSKRDETFIKTLIQLWKNEDIIWFSEKLLLQLCKVCWITGSGWNFGEVGPSGSSAKLKQKGSDQRGRSGFYFRLRAQCTLHCTTPPLFRFFASFYFPSSPNGVGKTSLHSFGSQLFLFLVFTTRSDAVISFDRKCGFVLSQTFVLCLVRLMAVISSKLTWHSGEHPIRHPIPAFEVLCSSSAGFPDTISSYQYPISGCENDDGRCVFVPGLLASLPRLLHPCQPLPSNQLQPLHSGQIANSIIVISMLIASSASIKNPKEIYLSIYWLAMSNSMYNPMIYCYMNQRSLMFKRLLNMKMAWTNNSPTIRKYDTPFPKRFSCQV